MTGNEYKLKVARYIVAAYGARGVDLFDEVTIGTSLLGKPRRIDLLILERESKKALALECKYQDSAGTADEKIPYALADMEHLEMPVCLVYAGKGWSGGILHMLRASPLAAYCEPDEETLAPSEQTRELDAALARTFKWWDLVVRGKQPFTLAKRGG